MTIKALVNKKDSSFGTLQDQGIRYTQMPDPMPVSVTMEDLRKYIKLECLTVLDDYELQTFELIKI